jgi:hypothetical protein
VRWGIESNPLLPVARIAAAVKTGNDEEGIGFNEKKERVGKFLRSLAPQSLEDNGKLSRIVGHALDGAVNFGAKATA